MHFLFLECLAPALYIGICLPRVCSDRRVFDLSSTICLRSSFASLPLLPCAWSDKLVTFTVRIRPLIKLNPNTLQCVRLFACDVIGHFEDLNYYSIETFANKVRD